MCIYGHFDLLSAGSCEESLRKCLARRANRDSSPPLGVQNDSFTKQHSRKNYFLWIIASIGLGSLLGAVAGSFMYAQHYLIVFLWETLPQYWGGLNTAHIFITSVIGGLIVGVGQKYLGDEPQSMYTIMHNEKTGKNIPGIKTNIVTGWKGGEFFPVMFASAAIGLGISNLIPGIQPMVAIAALMAATVTIVRIISILR
jgi:H+/Cl- antiporter ClcA